MQYLIKITSRNLKNPQQLPRLLMNQQLGQHRPLDFYTSCDSLLWKLPTTTATIPAIYQLGILKTVSKLSFVTRRNNPKYHATYRTYIRQSTDCSLSAVCRMQAWPPQISKGGAGCHILHTTHQNHFSRLEL